MKELTEIVTRMAGKRILVIGDMIADIYLEGRIARISREAPVLVLEYERERVVAGGAANVVNNAATLGGAPIAVGLVGDDRGGEGLKAILRENGAQVEALDRRGVGQWIGLGPDAVVTGDQDGEDVAERGGHLLDDPAR